MTFLIAYLAAAILVTICIAWPLCRAAARTDRAAEARITELKRQNRIDAQRKWDARTGGYE